MIDSVVLTSSIVFVISSLFILYVSNELNSSHLSVSFATPPVLLTSSSFPYFPTHLLLSWSSLLGLWQTLYLSLHSQYVHSFPFQNMHNFFPVYGSYHVSPSQLFYIYPEFFVKNILYCFFTIVFI